MGVRLRLQMQDVTIETKGIGDMSMLHELRKLHDLEYRINTSAQQAIIDEIRGLRQDLYNAGGPLSSELAYAILQLCERLERDC